MCDPVAVVVHQDSELGDTTYQSQLRTWLFTHTKDRWDITGPLWLPKDGMIRKFWCVVFENPKEATHFKLVFG